MASNPTRRDQTRFCAFHGEHGHDTEECKQLKIEIERLIRRGALRQFVKTNDSSRNRKDRHKKPGEKEKEEEQPLEVVGTINIISLPFEVRSKERTSPVTLEAKNSLRKSETRIKCITSSNLYKPHDDQISYAKRYWSGKRKVRRNSGNCHSTGDIGRRRALTVDTMDAREGSAADMPIIDPEVACHRLGVPPEAVPVRQKMRQFGAERTATIKEEIEKLKEAGFIKEINFCEWLSNVVMDNYALPNIDELVDNSFGYEVLSFCDAYSGYNQIPLAEEDQDKTAFIAVGETYCYIVMPFGLKNAGATYQHFANKIFVLLKEKCVEVYVDDLIIKSRSLDQHLEDLEQVFNILQEYGMKLNPLKCTFGVKAGKFLGFMLTSRGIEANPEKVRAIIEMKPPASIKEVQHLMGKIVALGRFLSKSAESENGSGAGIILTSPEGETFEYALKFTFEASNNRAEYEALLGGLWLAKAVNVEYIKIFSDSQLVVNQVKGDFNAQETIMTKYLEKVAQLLKLFKGYEMHHIKRTKTSKVDALARLASLGVTESGKEIYVEELSSPSISEEEILEIEEEEVTWMNPIKRYLFNGDLPEDKKEAQKLKKKAAWYTILGDHLYQRSYTHPWLKCLTPNEAKTVMEEIHEGECSNHIGAESLSYKILRQGYFWPTMKMDTREYIKRCDKCQRFARIQHQPSNPLHLVTAPWPFAKWGMDILGPFLEAKGKKKYLIVAIDYFTKWVEAEAVAKIT
ncbi:hypothetical protein SLEP1_g6759 [Rubroshorea leprosula]|uniref:Integrase catalytic domain-containing protein n=1 Tax=Rubroshorea leprosula TaxID=152421 RepID=A0AAV5I625_9ROSI|nr:hypothetical protein SLEP1_g6759 [Rubroshorea leprosula]